MGCRKEAAALWSGQGFGARQRPLFCSYRSRGELHRSASREQLSALSVGGSVYTSPCPRQKHRTGLKYANNPVPAAWHPARPIHFAREMIE